MNAIKFSTVSLIIISSVFFASCKKFQSFSEETNVLESVNFLEAEQNFITEHYRYESECGYISISYYMHDSKIQKIYFSYSEGCGREDGISLIEYFDLDGKPLKVSYFSLNTGEESDQYCYTGRGNANFLSSDVDRICAEINPDRGNVEFHKKFLPPCDEKINEISQFFSGNPYCYFKDEKSAGRVLDKERTLKKNNVKSLEYVAKGSFVNSINVNMRKEPKQDSESLGHLYPLEPLKILEKGPEDTIEGIGTNFWYKVQVKTYVYMSPGSQYREETEGWIFGTFIHNYSE